MVGDLAFGAGSAGRLAGDNRAGDDYGFDPFCFRGAAFREKVCRPAGF